MGRTIEMNFRFVLCSAVVALGLVESATSSSGGATRGLQAGGTTCERVIVDFTAFTRGDSVVAGVSLPGGITIKARRFIDNDDTFNDGMIFDARAPSGRGADLSNFKFLGKMLIISEDNNSADPDAAVRGGQVKIEFPVKTTIHSIRFIDVENIDNGDEGKSELGLFDEDGVKIRGVKIKPMRSGGQKVMRFREQKMGLRSITVNLRGSGAIDDIIFSPDECRSPPPAPQGISFPDGFPCDVTDTEMVFNPGNLAYPQFIATDSSNRCFLRMTDDVAGVVSTSAQQNFNFSDSNSEKLFSVKFGYRIYGDRAGHADGMTFVMHQDPRGVLALGGPGGYLGVYNRGALINALIIELDTHSNPNLNDDGENNVHVVSVGADGIATELAESEEREIRNGGETGYVWVDYCGDDTLRIFLNRLSDIKPVEPEVTASIDLSAFFIGNRVTVGFTGATWTEADYHDVMSWTMQDKCGI